MFAVNPARALYDTLRNFVTGLGTAKDPRTSSHWVYRDLDRMVLENAYRSDWLARRLVDLPAYDRAREWRTWQATGKQLQAIDRLEKRLFIQNKTMQAETRARLYGGGALVMGVDVGESEDELDPDDVGKDDLKFVVVLNRYELAAGPRIYNVNSPYYTRPEYYTVATPMFGFEGEEGGSFPSNPTQQNLVTPPRTPQGGSPLLSDPMRKVQPSYGMIRIHPSRVIEFAGNPLPDWRLAPMGGGWGDSVLQTIDDSLRDFSMIVSGLASVVNDMKLDVVSVPELSRHLGNEDMSKKFLERWQLANQAKSTINTLLIDEKEKWERIQTSFGGTSDLIRVAMQVACAAGGVPMSRVMGMAPNRGIGTQGGSSGEVDLRAYYDDQVNIQKTDNRRIMFMLDRILVASAIGSNDEDVDYSWNPLYREDPAEQADVALKKAQTTQIYVGLGLINEDAMRDGVVSQLTEDNTYPALEQAIDEYGAEPEEPEAPPPQMLPTPPPGMMNKGQFETNPFHMLRAQQALKTGQPMRVPPNDPRRAIAAPQPRQFGKDGEAGAATRNLAINGILGGSGAADRLDDFNPNHDPKTGRFTTSEGSAEGQARAAAREKRSAAMKASYARRRRSASAKAAHARRVAREQEAFPLPANATAHQAGVTAVSRVMHKQMTQGAPPTRKEVAQAAKSDVQAAVEAYAATRTLKEPKLPEGTSPDMVKTAYRLGVTVRRFVTDPESRKVIAQALTKGSISFMQAAPQHFVAVAHHGAVEWVADHFADMVTDAVLDGVVAAGTGAGALVGGPAGAAVGGAAGGVFAAAIKQEVKYGVDKMVEESGLEPEHLKSMLGGVGHALSEHYRKWRRSFGHLTGWGQRRISMAAPSDGHLGDADGGYDPIEDALMAVSEAIDEWEP